MSFWAHFVRIIKLFPRVVYEFFMDDGTFLAAGIALSTEEGADLVEAVRFGMAAAAHNAELLLPARLDRGRTEELVREVKVSRLS